MIANPKANFGVLYNPRTSNSATQPPTYNCKAIEKSAALRDPVCGMTVTPQSFHQSQHEGQTYCFCSSQCKSRFDARPVQFIAASLTVPNAAWHWCLQWGLWMALKNGYRRIFNAGVVRRSR